MAARKRPERPGRDTPAGDGEGFPEWEHGAFTFEGEIERLGSIGRNLSTAPRWTRIVARVVAVVVLLPLVLGLVWFLVGLVAG